MSTRNLGILVASICLLFSCGSGGEPSSSKADYKTITYNDMTLNYYEQWGGYVVEDYLGHENSIRIPEEVTDDQGRTLPITRVSDHAFYGRSSIQEVYLSRNVVSIGEKAFEKTSLRHLEVTESLYDIDRDFYGDTPFQPISDQGLLYLSTATKQKAILFGGKCSVSDYALSSETYSVLASRPFEGVALDVSSARIHNFGDGALAGSGVTRIVIPSDAKRFGEGVFENCAALTDVTFEEGFALGLPASTFHGCTALARLIIPSTVPSMGQGILNGCNAVSTLTLPFLGESVARPGRYSDVINNEMTRQVPFTLTVDHGNLVEGALSDGSNSDQPIKLTSLTLVHVREVGAYACKRIRSLTSLDLGDSLIWIGLEAFLMTGITDVFIPKSVATIGQNALWCEQNLVIEIEKQFSDPLPYGNPYQWSNTDTALIRYGVAPTDKGIVYGDFTFTPSDDGLKLSAYKGTSSDVVVPSNVNGKPVYGAIGGAFLSGASIQKLTLPVRSRDGLANESLRGLSNLTELTLMVANETTFLDLCMAFGTKQYANTYTVKRYLSSYDYTYYIPSGLAKLNVFTSESVAFDDTFVAGFSSLVNVNIESNQASYLGSSFANCANLEGTFFVRTIDKAKATAFVNCPKILVQFEGDVPSDFIDAGINVEGNVSGKSVEDDSFVYDLTSAGAIVTSIKTTASELTIPATVSGNEVVGMNSGLFNESSNVKKLTIGAPNFDFSKRCFKGLTQIESITLATYPRINGDASAWFGMLFGDKAIATYAPNSTKVTIGKNTYEAYIPLSLSAVSLGQGDIPTGCFMQFTSLTEVSLPEDLTYIPKQAFYWCSKLGKIRLPSALNSIRAQAFYQTRLSSISFPASLRSIGEEAFYGGLSGVVELPLTIESIERAAFGGCFEGIFCIKASSIPSAWSSPTSSQFCVLDFKELREIDGYSLTISQKGSSEESAYVIELPQGIQDFTVEDTIKGIALSGVRYAALSKQKQTLTAIRMKDPSVSLVLGSSFTSFPVLEKLIIATPLSHVTLSDLPCLTEASFGGLTEIRGNDFVDLPRLTTLTLPEGITSIAMYSFIHLAVLTELYLPSSITRIETRAFLDCPNLTLYCLFSESMEGLAENWNNGLPVVYDAVPN